MAEAKTFTANAYRRETTKIMPLKWRKRGNGLARLKLRMSTSDMGTDDCDLAGNGHIAGDTHVQSVSGDHA